MSVVMAYEQRHHIERGTAVFVSVMLIAAVVALIYARSFAAMFDLWKLSSYQHSFAVFAGAAWILWRRRRYVAAQPLQASWVGVGLTVVVAAVWLMGVATSVQAVEHAAALVAIPIAVLAILGRSVFAAAAFPLLLILLAAPIWEVLTPSLMIVTARVSTFLLALCGVPVEQQGMYLSLPGGDFLIADVCSGLNFLLVGIVLALMFASYTYRSAPRRFVFVAAAAFVFVLGNGVRAFIVMFVASATNLRYLAGYDHIVFGMVFFVLLLAGLFWIGTKYTDVPDQPVAAANAYAPDEINWRGSFAAIVGVVLALLGGPVAHAYIERSTAVALAIQVPLLADCAVPGEWRAAWRPVIHGADQEMRASYSCGSSTLHVMSAAYTDQHQGKEIVGSGNEIVPKQWWMVQAVRTTTVERSGGRPLTVNEAVLSGAGVAMVTWYWYAVNDRVARSPFAVKWLEALAALRLQPTVTRAYVVSVESPAAYAPEMSALALRAADALLRETEQP